MKRIALLALAFMLMATTSAFAAAPQPQEFTQDENGAYTVTASDLTNANQYVLLVIKDTTDSTSLSAITVDNIMYIDQQAADASGAVNFSTFKPKSAGAGNKVFLGGQGLNAPLYLGTLEKGAGVTVSGKVEYLSGKIGRLAHVELEDSSSGQFLEVDTNINGVFEVTSVPEGTYEIKASAESHTSHTKTGVLIGEDITDLNFRLYPGEVTSNVNIDVYDLADLLQDYNKTRLNASNIKTDITGDNNINVYDLAELLASYNKSSVKE